jgi:hypothetical protein
MSLCRCGRDTAYTCDERGTCAQKAAHRPDLSFDDGRALIGPELPDFLDD